jgi:hypothetical protein
MAFQEKEETKMTYLMIRHRVNDFDQWKVAYDNHSVARQESGLTERYLMRSTDNSNEVVILFEAPDLAKARAFTESPDLREAMQKAGVTDQPDFYFLNG